MSELMQQGLTLSVLGLGLTFAGLGLLVGVMVLLGMIFQVKKTEPESAVPADTRDDEIAAAITTALMILRARELPAKNLGAALENGTGHWWHRGLARQHQMRTRFSRGRE